VRLYQFNQCVEAYHGHKNIKKLSCHEQFLAMLFGQFSYRESLRDVVACLSAHKSKLYHLGFKSSIARSTLAEANEKRDWRIYWDFAQVLITEARALYVSDTSFTLDLKNACYAIDSTSIELCLALFPWSPYVSTKAAVKMHTVLDLRGSIPTFFHMTSGKVNDVKFLDMVLFERGAFYVMDRGYLDFCRLHTIHKAGAFFVTRAKENTRMQRRYSNKVEKSLGVRSDQIVLLTGKHTPQKYPDTLRRVKYYDQETEQMYVFLTNNVAVSAYMIADLYKHRWQIELFFKWIKQHLKIKVFWGRSENAVKTQICIALCAYLLVAILKKRLELKQNIYEILQILSVSLFDKTPLPALFSDDLLHKRVDRLQNTLPGMEI
jgi:hypothetical protein